MDVLMGLRKKIWMLSSLVLKTIGLQRKLVRQLKPFPVNLRRSLIYPVCPLNRRQHRMCSMLPLQLRRLLPNTTLWFS